MIKIASRYGFTHIVLAKLALTEMLKRYVGLINWANLQKNI